MRPVFLAFALAVSACATPEPYDPTGVWSMTARWGIGSCGATVGSTTRQDVLVVRSGDMFAATTNQPNETTTGTVRSDADSASLSLVIVNHDALDDGGSTISTVEVGVTADAELAITGGGSVRLDGAISCGQVFTLSGELAQ